MNNRSILRMLLCLFLIGVVRANTWSASAPALRWVFGGMSDAFVMDGDFNEVVRHGRSLSVALPRTYARAGDRWVDVLVEARLPGDVRQFEFMATLHDPRAPDGFAPLARLAGRPAVTDAVEPAGGASPFRGLLRVDMRQHGLATVRLRIELRVPGAGDAGPLGVEEMILDAHGPAATLQPDTRIMLRVDRPDDLNPGSISNLPVTFGVPFPAGMLWDADAVCLMDEAGRTVPHQRQAVGRWGEDGAIKWLRFDALINAQTQLFVAPAGVARAGAPGAIIHLHDSGTNILVDTGAARFILGHGHSPLRAVHDMDGHPIVRAGARGLYVIDNTGQVAMAATGMLVNVESAGPIAATVRFEGDYQNAHGETIARHITRLAFHAGRPDAWITHTMIVTRDTKEIWFREIGWEFDYVDGSLEHAFFATDGDMPMQYTRHPMPPQGGAGGLRMSQVETTSLGLRPAHARPQFGGIINKVCARGRDRFIIERLDADGRATILHESGRMGDWAAVIGGRSGFMLSCRESARQGPKDFEVDHAGLKLRLFSPCAGGELDFRMPSLLKRWGLFDFLDSDASGLDAAASAAFAKRLARFADSASNAIGWSKTHELLLSVLHQDMGDAARIAGTLSEAHARRVFVHVNPDWMYQSMVFGANYPRDTVRFQDAEAVLDGMFRQAAGNFPHPYTGFTDFCAGPHYYYHNRYRMTYSFLADCWLLYARSGDRGIREFAQSANRAFFDNYVAHWGGPGKTRGLFLACNGTSDGFSKADFPLYWESGTHHSLFATSNLQRLAWDYYISGYSRGADIIRQFADAMKADWKPDTPTFRVAAVLRILAQLYEFTWDPDLRVLLEKTMRARMYDPDGELLLTKDHHGPYQASSYKMQRDMDVFVEIGDLLGVPPYYQVAEKLGWYFWDKAGMDYICSGANAHFLWRRSHSPVLADGMDYFRRVSGTFLADPASGVVHYTSWSQYARYLQGLPLAMDILAQTGADRASLGTWLAFITADMPASLFLRKPADLAVEILVRPPAATNGACNAVCLRPHAFAKHAWAGQGLYTVREFGGAVRVRVPKDAPAGVYELQLRRAGKYEVFADRRLPMVLRAPGAWAPAPMRPPRRVYFKVPPGGEVKRIHFAAGAMLFTPENMPFDGGTRRSGWVDLPADAVGLWSFEAVDSGIVRGENLSGFFAMGDPQFYFEHAVEKQ